MKAILSAMAVGSSALDIAFGTDRFVDMYLERGMRIYRIDSSGGLLAVAEQELEAPDRVVYPI
jgi:hypothetical protein